MQHKLRNPLVLSSSITLAISFLLIVASQCVVDSNAHFSHPTSYHVTSFTSDSLHPSINDEWAISTPEEQMMNSTRLNEIMEYIQDNNLAIDSLLILRNGYLVMEEYPTGNYDAKSLHRLYSVTKSIVSSLIGIAIREGFIENVEQKMIDFFSNHTIENLDSRKEQITLEHLLTMTPGFEWDQWTYPTGDPRDSITKMIESSDWVQFLLDLPMVADPGTKWMYNSGASHLLSAIIQRTSGMNTLDFAKQYLFEPLNIQNVTWGIDPQGVYHGGGTMNMTSRDMAKIGYLYLNNGLWNDTQIFSSDWASRSSSEYINLGTYDPSLSHAGYGYQMWNIPSMGVYYATGMYGQKIYIFPTYDLVVVFTATMYADENPENIILTDYIVPSILEDTSQPDAVLQSFYSSFLLTMAIPLLIIIPYWVIKEFRLR